MSDVNGWLAYPAAVALGWALLHFLWQGAAIGGAFAVVRSATRRASASTRYLIACAALAAMAVMPVATFLIVRGEGREASVSPFTTPVVAMPAGVHLDLSPTASEPAAHYEVWDRSRLDAAIPWLVCAWFAGVGLLSLRFAGALVLVARLRRATHAAAPVWQRACDDLAARLGVRATVRLCESALAEVPSVVGWLRPVVVVPAGIFTGLDPRQLEAILAHELAHVRRHDYLVNLAQTAIETLLFYHPAVWWISREIREEREHCCDDLAVAACGDVVVYASALVDLEELRAAPRMAVAATGGSLVRRVERLLGRAPARNAAPACIAFVLVLVVAGATLASAGSTAISTVEAQDFATAPVPPAPPAPLHATPPAPPARPAEAPAAPATAELLAPDTPPAVPAVLPVPAIGPLPPAPPAPPMPRVLHDHDQEDNTRAAADFAAAGYPKLTDDQLDAFRWQGVTPDYVRELAARGYTNLSANAILAMHVQGVSPRMIDSLRELGYEHPSPNELVAMAVQGVDAAYIREFRDLGFEKLSVSALVAMRVQGVSGDYVRAMREAGYADLSWNALVAARVQGVSPSYIAELGRLGFARVDFNDLIAMRVQGVSAAYVQDIQSLGYTPTVKQLIAMRVHGVTANYIRAVVDRYGKVSIDRLIDLKVRGQE